MKYVFSWPTIYIYTLGVIVISVFPVDIPKKLTFNLFDKVVHFFVFGLLAFIVLNAALIKDKSNPQGFSFLYAFILGLIIEIIHFFLPFRYFQFSDIAANFFGAAAGSFIRVAKHERAV